MGIGASPGSRAALSRVDPSGTQCSPHPLPVVPALSHSRLLPSELYLWLLAVWHPRAPMLLSNSLLPSLKALLWAFQDGSRLRRSCGPCMVCPNLPFPIPDSSLCPTQAAGKEAKPYPCWSLRLVFSPPSSPLLLKDFKFMLEGVSQSRMSSAEYHLSRFALLPGQCDVLPLSTELPAFYCVYPFARSAPV